MSSEQIVALRYLVVAASGYFGAKYGITPDQAVGVFNALVTLATAAIAFGSGAYAVWKTLPSQKVKSAANLPGVTVAVPPDLLANDPTLTQNPSIKPSKV